MTLRQSIKLVMLPIAVLVMACQPQKEKPSIDGTYELQMDNGITFDIQLVTSIDGAVMVAWLAGKRSR